MVSFFMTFGSVRYHLSRSTRTSDPRPSSLSLSALVGPFVQGAHPRSRSSEVFSTTSHDSFSIVFAFVGCERMGTSSTSGSNFL